MQYGLAFNYVLNRTGGFANLLLMTVCNFIPVVGPIVLLGYRSEVAVALLEDEERRRHPKFDFNYFAEYLTRGVWPFVVALIVGVGAATFAVAAFLVGMMVATAQAEAGVILAILGYAGTLILASMLAAPMQFHAEIAGKFDLAGSFRFAKSFWLTVGGQAILAWVIFVPLSMAVMFVGLLVCVVGVYPAVSLIQMASQHLMVQLYDEYLDRGGDAIPVFEPPDEDEEDDRRSRRRRRRRRDEDEEEEWD